MRLRVALVPNALLHLGQARLALLTWLTARHHKARLTLRLDDADPAAAREDHRETIPHDLAWLGLDWDTAVLQSDRLDIYAAAADRLRASGRLYPCFENDEELATKRDLRQRRGKPAIYDRAMLELTPAQRAKAEANGKRPYWRFLLNGTAEWGDMVLGRQRAKLSAISDPIVVRADGTPLPPFTGAVDDHDLAITHVLRDADLATVSAIQLDIRAALGARPNSLRYGHIPPIGALDADHGRRTHLPTLRSLRADGIEPAALAGTLATLGTDRVAAPAVPQDLVPGWDLTRIGRDKRAFDPAALLATNRAALASAPFEAVQARLPQGATPAFWHAVRGGIDLLREARLWWDVVAGTIVPPFLDGEGDALRAAIAHLPPEPWDDTTWDAWTGAVATAVHRPMPGVDPLLRLALTGEDDGPPLAPILPLIGHARALRRLTQAAGPAARSPTPTTAAVD